MNKCLISQDNGKLQIPYEDYKILIEKVQEGRRLQQVKTDVVANLKNFLGGKNQIPEIIKTVEAAKIAAETAPAAPAAEKVSIEFAVEKSVAEAPKAKNEGSVDAKEYVSAKTARRADEDLNVPPIKKEISDHFNKVDSSGRLFSVFKQYYTCLNDTCGGTVRVTMKDGFCSLWNYDEWEEFAFIDLFEGHLRVSVDPRYTGELQSLNFCEVPRLLSTRRSLVSVQVDDLSNTMLGLLVKAFEEVGLTAN